MINERKRLAERLAAYPELYQRVEALLAVVEGDEEEVMRADEAEERVDEQVRGLGQDVLQSWAQRQAGRQERAWDRRVGVTRKEKKVSGG